jgi:DNA-directed RNA polymerase delta subunit
MGSNSVASIAEEILRARNRPLHYLELTRRILKKRPISGSAPYNTVASVLVKDSRFKRVAEGVYGLASWTQYPVARFGNDIAYDVLKSRNRPITLSELGKEILKERPFNSSPSTVGRNAMKSDKRFIFDRTTRLVSLSEWKKK